MITKKNILISAGGTGGHFFPALALFKELKENSYKTHFITDKRCSYYIAEDLKNQITVQKISKFQRSPVQLFIFAFSLGFFVVKNLWFIQKHKIDIVITFGGYQGIAVLIAAFLMRKKIIIHEQNIIAGRTNKLFAKIANVVAVAYKNQQGFEQFQHKQKFTGIPVRSEFYQQMPNKTSDKFVIFVVGGSQGADFFNKLMFEILAHIDSKRLDQIEIVQQVRAEFINDVKAKYEEIGVSAQIDSFFNDMANRIHSADLVISRSGASTIAELIAARKPAIFIPYSHAMDNHQYYNALELKNIGVAKLYEEKTLVYSEMAQFIDSIVQNPTMLSEMSGCFDKALPGHPIDDLIKIIDKL
jgi:UDP-N-acetylglucosamine--N-acetylmuramyl-(pentapeptide) pyrophosphoryl-undecaprenol N-acetylglucosamine transferase